MKYIELIEHLFAEYGYLVLLIGLPLDMIALPIPPGNTTLTYTGFLAYKGTLNVLLAVGVAYAGAVLGLTITYWMGNKLGIPLVERYGKWLFLKPSHLERTKRSYDKYGKKVLLFSFFIPGVRQFTGYFAGMIRVPFRTFVLYAYSGAALWVVAFVGIGYVFGDQWQFVFRWVQQSLAYLAVLLVAALAGYLLLKWRRRANRRTEKESRYGTNRSPSRDGE
jgi:membrane protein DedA with SNARE-associated domain